MGGNLLKEMGSQPIPAELAKSIGKEVVTFAQQLLDKMQPGSRVRMLQSYRTKALYGDVDLMITESFFENFTPQTFATELGKAMEIPFEAVEPRMNAPVFSIPYPVEDHCAQIDFIKVKDKSFDFASNYLDWNGVCSFIHTLSKDLGPFLFEESGLMIEVMDGDQKVGKIVVSDDFDKCLSFLGYDANRYGEGFESAEDLYSFVTSSPYFYRSLYTERRQNSKKKRKMLRPFYINFLTWLSVQDVQHDRAGDGTDWVSHAFDQFPMAKQRFDEFMDDYQNQLKRKDEFKKRFNGELVSEMTGLKGNDLGLFIESFKQEIDTKNFEDFVLSLSTEAFQKMLKRHHYVWKGRL